MKLIKTLLFLLVLGSSNLVLANDGVGEHANGCGPNSTCGECINSSTGPDDGGTVAADAEGEEGGVETR